MLLLRLFLVWGFGYSVATVGAQEVIRITNEAAEPLAYAYVYLWQDTVKQSCQADAAGEVPFPDFRPDSIRASALGYAERRATWAELAAQGFRLSLAADRRLLDVATVVGRREESLLTLPQQVGLIAGEAIAQAQLLTTADALEQLGGVYVQRSQFGGGSPVLRGFEANRVLLVVDGVRMNNAIYRSGHLQNAITVDPLALDRIEVLYGPGAIAYGSDAIGGVVHFRTREPRLGEADARPDRARLDLAWNTAAQALTTSARLEYGTTGWAGLTLLSVAKTSHLRAGAHRPDRFPDFGRRDFFVQRRAGRDVVVPNEAPDVQRPSGYEQLNLLQKFRFRLQPRLELRANLQFSTSSNIPRYDNLSERRDGQLRWARWDYGPQTRTLAALHLQDRRKTKAYDVANYRLSHQFIAEDRITRRLDNLQEEHNLEAVQTTQLQLDFSRSLTTGINLSYGADLRYDVVKSTAFFQQVDTGERTSGLATRYPSAGSSLAGLGGYAEGNYALGDSWQLRGGLRWSGQQLRATFGANDPVAWPAFYLRGITNEQAAFTTAFGLRHARGWRGRFAQGFRAPNIDDFAKFRERNGFIQVPNPGLKPERSLTLELGRSWDNGQLFGRRLAAEVTVWYSWLRAAIIRQAGTLPDGRDVFDSRGDTLRVQTNVNADRARVWGGDFVLRYALTPTWTLETAGHYLYGRRQQRAPDGELLTLPQDHIPPAYGNTSLRWQKARWSAEVQLRYQLAKRYEDYAVGAISGTAASGYILDRTGTSDNLEFTPFLTDERRFAGVYGWWTVGGQLSWQPAASLTLRLSGGNLLDVHYRTFASGISAPGRHIRAGIGWRL